MSTDPELDEEEGIVRALLVQLLQASLLLGEFVVDLPHVDGLQHGVIVARLRRADVYEQVFILWERKEA